ncbi:hypothetical protein GLAREA_03202 [Glarea lozoyensis ATCC 20868]|uniref:Uncharacterized protein n=1 Tax=Glarea lozoyensis (strain ATCC 20868 / MF5171) TaxID=1116229 RepID=S3CLE8_GLAL2|nr:uncharacterized protein GLAREA_03202 [Glarea lozoyensis ATCC 20868]EPE27287.1 hypothetical protein GLAREA_03202 [Glarea lozoyensis ATCC 20868]
MVRRVFFMLGWFLMGISTSFIARSFFGDLGNGAAQKVVMDEEIPNANEEVLQQMKTSRWEPDIDSLPKDPVCQRQAFFELAWIDFIRANRQKKGLSEWRGIDEAHMLSKLPRDDRIVAGNYMFIMEAEDYTLDALQTRLECGELHDGMVEPPSSVGPKDSPFCKVRLSTVYTGAPLETDSGNRYRACTINWYPSEEVCEVLKPLTTVLVVKGGDLEPARAAVDILASNGLALNSLYTSHMKLHDNIFNVWEKSVRTVNSTDMKVYGINGRNPEPHVLLGGNKVPLKQWPLGWGNGGLGDSRGGSSDLDSTWTVFNPTLFSFTSDSPLSNSVAKENWVVPVAAKDEIFKNLFFLGPPRQSEGQSHINKGWKFGEMVKDYLDSKRDDLSFRLLFETRNRGHPDPDVFGRQILGEGLAIVSSMSRMNYTQMLPSFADEDRSG